MADTVKLFVFSNSYTARILLKCLEYMKIDDLEIILLSELGVSNNINLTIHVFETLQQCVEACTQILVVRNETIPEAKIDMISLLANAHNKFCTIVPEFRNKPKNYPTKNNFEQKHKEKPLILIVSYGAQTQISCWEILIYKLLIDNNLKFLPAPSNELNNVLEWFKLCHMSNKFFVDRYISESEYEVEVQCIEYDPEIKNEVNDILFGINPDVMIVSVCNNYYNYDEIRNIFKYKYGRVIDLFAKSELVETINDIGKKQFIFDFSSFCTEKDSALSLNDPLLLGHISKTVLPKIVLPEGVAII